MAVFADYGRPVINLKILHKICRLCACHDVPMKAIFEGNTRSIPDIKAKIFYCTAVELSEAEKLPSQICEACTKLLETFYMFKMRCVDVNIKLLELIKEDVAATQHVPSKSPPSANAALNQTADSHTCAPDIIQKHETTRTEGILSNEKPGLLDNSRLLTGPTRQNVDDSICTTVRQTENAQQTTTAKIQPKNVCTDRQSNVSCIETIKVEADEMEIFQTDPLELVSCSYANGVNELKPEIPNMLDEETIRPNNQSKSNNEKRIESLKLFIKSEEVLPVDLPSVNRESSKENVDKTCNDCRVTIKFCELLNRHMCTICLEQRNKNGKTFECNICSKVFQSKHILSKHLKFHSQLFKFKCSACGLRFNSSKILNRHCKFKHKENTNLKCTFCKTPKQYKSHNDLFTHTNKMHSTEVGFNSGTTTNDKTGKPISHSSDYLEQLNMFKSKGSVDNVSVSQGPKKKIAKTLHFTCVICNQAFREKKALENHVRTHNNRNENSDCKPKGESQNKSEDANLCSYCGKIFSSKKLLYQHVKLTHLSVKDHKCKFCDKSYKRSSVLQNHIEAIHEKKKFQCTLCGSLLSSINSFHSHMKKHEIRNREPTIKCPVCPKLFKQKKNVDQHMRSHTGETPFKCSHCPREFTLRWNLIQHERLHKGEKRYKCELCGKAFTHNVSRKNHMKYHKEEADVITGEDYNMNATS